MNHTIDAHQHFWQLTQPFDYKWLDTPELAPIRRDFLPGDLEPLLKSSGIQKSILVQTQHDLRENSWALALADQHPFIAGVVGWVDLASADCERQLVEVMNHPRLVGIRHVTQDEPDDDFIVREDVSRGLHVLESHGVPFDLLLYVKHLHHVTTLSHRFPRLKMVIDHLAKPDIKHHDVHHWLPLFKAAAHFPNVYCKLSGMVTEASWENWNANDFRPYVQAALDAFGPDRLMFGSDWPVCRVAASYSEVVESLKAALGPLSESERAAIFGGTAASFYSIVF